MGRYSRPRPDGLPQRMFPRYGGEPLPWPPIVAPPFMWPLMRDIWEVAAWYVKVLQKELDSGTDGTPKKWDSGQKAYISQRRDTWFHRSERCDAHYNKYGTFPRYWGAEGPTIHDMECEKLRRQAMDNGTYVSNAEHQRTHTFGSLSKRIRAEQTKRLKAEAAAQALKEKPKVGPWKPKVGNDGYDE